MTSEFAAWVEKEMESREWLPATLSKKAGVDQGVISRILNNERNPGITTLVAIADALEYPPEIVFRKAGILPPEPEQSEQVEELTYLFGKFPEKEKEDLLTYMRIKLKMISDS